MRARHGLGAVPDDPDRRDKPGRKDVSALMGAWQGRTPDGYPLLVELDERGRWVVTVASASRSRSVSLEAALLEAGGESAPREWAAQAAAVITAHHAETLSEPSMHSSRTGAP